MSHHQQPQSNITNISNTSSINTNTSNTTNTSITTNTSNTSNTTNTNTNTSNTSITSSNTSFSPIVPITNNNNMSTTNNTTSNNNNIQISENTHSDDDTSQSSVMTVDPNRINTRTSYYLFPPSNNNNINPSRPTPSPLHANISTIPQQSPTFTQSPNDPNIVPIIPLNPTQTNITNTNTNTTNTRNSRRRKHKRPNTTNNTDNDFSDNNNHNRKRSKSCTRKNNNNNNNNNDNNTNHNSNDPKDRHVSFNLTHNDDNDQSNTQSSNTQSSNTSSQSSQSSHSSSSTPNNSPSPPLTNDQCAQEYGSEIYNTNHNNNNNNNSSILDGFNDNISINTQELLNNMDIAPVNPTQLAQHSQLLANQPHPSSLPAILPSTHQTLIDSLNTLTHKHIILTKSNNNDLLQTNNKYNNNPEIYKLFFDILSNLLLVYFKYAIHSLSQFIDNILPLCILTREHYKNNKWNEAMVSSFKFKFCSIVFDNNYNNNIYINKIFMISIDICNNKLCSNNGLESTYKCIGIISKYLNINQQEILLKQCINRLHKTQQQQNVINATIIFFKNIILSLNNSKNINNYKNILIIGLELSNKLMTNEVTRVKAIKLTIEYIKSLHNNNNNIKFIIHKLSSFLKQNSLHVRFLSLDGLLLSVNKYPMLCNEFKLSISEIISLLKNTNINESHYI